MDNSSSLGQILLFNLLKHIFFVSMSIRKRRTVMHRLEQSDSALTFVQI